jgi:DNA-binding MltR family transcriptional regulator
MAASRNRGVKKPKLRDYSHLVLTSEEKEAVAAAAHSVDQHPIVTAILGYVLVEHEIDILIRKKFKKKDETTWEKLQGESGPLRSFSTKITIGYAFGIYNDKIQNDLNIVRVIRNAFAHSKKLLEFDDPLVIPELLSAHLLPAKFKKYLRKKGPGNQLAKASFIVICLRLQAALMRKQTNALRAQNYRRSRRGAKSPLTNALLGYGYGSPTSLPYSSPLQPFLPKSNEPPSLDGQSAGPNSPTQQRSLAGLYGPSDFPLAQSEKMNKK